MFAFIIHTIPEPYADPEYLYWREEENGIWRQRGTQMIWENKTEYFQATGRDTSFNRQRTADVWWQIANRYKEETQILGYELMNEPYFYPITGVTDQDLREFYYQLVGAIRDVDQNHMVITEGNIFAIEIGGLLPPWDDNMAVAFHRLWRPTSMDVAGEMQGYLDARDQDPVPFLMTEAGENSDPWIYEMKNFLESLNMGWFFWGFKKVGMDLAMHYEIQPTEDYRYVVENWRDSPNPDRERIRRGLMDLTESIKSENCRIQPGWFASMVDPSWSQVSKPYIDMSIPGRVFAAHYDVGNNGVAYSDTRFKNEVYLGEPSNSGFVYRNGGVDISITYEELGEDHLGYHVIDMEAGEWMKYTVNVQEPGWYAVRSRVRHVEGGTTARFNLEAAPVGQETTSAIVVDVLTVETSWSDIIPSSSFLYLASGPTVLTLTVLEGGMELAWMDLVATDIGDPTLNENDQVCSTCPGTNAVAEYRFNPTAASWETHRLLAHQDGCELASIANIVEQAAALAAMRPYIGYPYHATENVGSSFAYLGGRVIPEQSNPSTGRYAFEWVDGSGRLVVQNGQVVEDGSDSTAFGFFASGDPNGDTLGFSEPFLALSLDENGSSGLRRGQWVDFLDAPSPALYKCCVPTCKTKSYHLNPLELPWEEHERIAKQSSCELATISSPEEQTAAEAALDPYQDYVYQEENSFGGSFVYIGGKLSRSDPVIGDYFFDWADGSGELHVYVEPHNIWSSAYSNFHENDPNGGTGFIGEEPYLALSLQKKGSQFIPKGKWVDFGDVPSPALYQCCNGVDIAAFGSCTVSNSR